MTIACLVILVVVGKEAYEDWYEDRRAKAWVALGVMGLVFVIWLLFGMGLIWKVARWMG